jgi:hypothetical protein
VSRCRYTPWPVVSPKYIPFLSSKDFGKCDQWLPTHPSFWKCLLAAENERAALSLACRSNPATPCTYPQSYLQSVRNASGRRRAIQQLIFHHLHFTKHHVREYNACKVCSSGISLLTSCSFGQGHIHTSPIPPGFPMSEPKHTGIHSTFAMR